MSAPNAPAAQPPTAINRQAATPSQARGLLFARALQVIMAADFCERETTEPTHAPKPTRKPQERHEPAR